MVFVESGSIQILIRIRENDTDSTYPDLQHGSLIFQAKNCKTVELGAVPDNAESNSALSEIHREGRRENCVNCKLKNK